MSISAPSFENTYQNLKRENKDGWNPERISQSMFEMISNILQRDNISNGNLLDLPYLSEKFDVVIDSFCFHCIIGEDRK